MKRKYETPQVEKIEFDYSDVVTASGQGHKYRLYTDSYYACRETPTDIWVDDPSIPHP